MTKPIQRSFDVTFDDKKYLSLTKRISNENLSEIPDIFFLSLFQEEIKKQYEIRSFYLDGEFYSMAIFSQKDAQTSEDFRHYNYEKPNRTVPYKLPEEICSKLKIFMNEIGLNCGSFDIIYDLDGNYIFLEVNPVGQFGFVSYPCNYYVERRIAEIFKQKINGK
jgi:ATP-GRASP peptide maturase of grasp-with-spasm system